MREPVVDLAMLLLTIAAAQLGARLADAPATPIGWTLAFAAAVMAALAWGGAYRPRFALELFESRIHRYDERHRVKAGITGWAQVHGLRGDTSLSDRIEWDNYCIENWSPWLDLKIVLLTSRTMLRGR